MRVVQLNNAIEVQDVDLENDADCIELGKLVAKECVLVVKQKISEQRLFEIHGLWGQPCKAILHRYVGEQRLTGKHWRSLLANLSHVSKGVDHIADRSGMSRVSFEKNEKGKPMGVFTNGKLDWHSDQQAYHDNQRIVGLMSLWGSVNSQTSFLCTAPAYEALSNEDRSMVDELVSVWEWDGGSMSEELIESQKEIVHYNMVPYPLMECPLLDETVTGVKGIRFPSHCFSHFKGMSKGESMKIKDYLWSILNKPEYIYTHDWQDGEVVFMDQNITLHARPTNVQDGDTRTMCRMISYLDNLYSDCGPLDHVLYNGNKLDHETFAKMVDEQRLAEYYPKAA